MKLWQLFNQFMPKYFYQSFKQKYQMSDDSCYFFL